MSVKSVHPLYTAMINVWQKGIDSYEGEDVIKAANTTYLPSTSGERIDGQGRNGTKGEADYQARKARAVYPSIYQEAVDAAIGIMHRKPPKIELPSQMKGMLEKATLGGESLEMLLRRINARQLITGRLGLLGDIRVGADNQSVSPVVVIYNEMAVRNWDDTSVEDDELDLRIVVLDESGYEMNENLEWQASEAYRILALIEGEGDGAVLGNSGEYRTTLVKADGGIVPGEFIAPNVKGEGLTNVPFVFVNSKDITSAPDRPPLDGLANLCLAIYRGEADYRQNLFMQGQDTLVRIGGGGDEEEIRTGAGAVINTPLNGDAKYIGVSGDGLSEQRTCLENDYARALQKSGQITDSTSKAKESGDALRIRVAAQTATLPQVAQAGAAGLQRVLRYLARWLGADENAVVVEPNLEFTSNEYDSKTLVDLVTAKELGAPISQESIHAWLREKGLTEYEYKKELALIALEEPLTVGLGDDSDNASNRPASEGDTGAV